jgi:hypothetical protein
MQRQWGAMRHGGLRFDTCVNAQYFEAAVNGAVSRAGIFRGSQLGYARRLLSGTLIVIIPRNETKIGCITGWQNPLLSAVKVAAVTGQNATRDVALLMVF